MADALKAQGNDEFNKGNWLKAAGLYTQAIKADPANAVLYSNRSAALLKLKKVTKALEDAEECIKLRPDWEKGYFRKGAIFEEQQQFAEALAVYQHATTLCPSNKELLTKTRSLLKLVKVSEREETTLENFIVRAVGEGPLAVFCTEVMELAAEAITADGPHFVPSLHFLPGKDAQAHDESERRVRATLAFTQPDFLTQFVKEMRELAAKLDAEAVISVVPKPAIAYPQVWNKANWPLGKNAGVFVQVETKSGLRRCWFVPVYDKLPGKPQNLAEDFCPIQPNLLKS